MGNQGLGRRDRLFIRIDSELGSHGMWFLLVEAI
jgi:hypothetical protein